MRPLGFITYLLLPVFGMFAQQIVLPTSRAVSGRSARTTCRTEFGGLLHRSNITNAIRKSIFQKYTSIHDRIDFWVAGCSHQEDKKRRECFGVSLFRNGMNTRCFPATCETSYRIICLAKHKANASPKTAVTPGSGAVLTTINSSTVLSGKLVLRYIVIPCISVILVILIVVVVWLMRRGKKRNSVRGETSQVYTNTSFEGRDHINRQISNMTYADPDEACIIPTNASLSAEYAEIEDESSRGQRAEAFCNSPALDGDTGNVYSYSILPIENSSEAVDASMGYANIAERESAVSTGTCNDQKQNHTRSLAAVDNFYVNTMLR